MNQFLIEQQHLANIAKNIAELTKEVAELNRQIRCYTTLKQTGSI